MSRILKYNKIEYDVEQIAKVIMRDQRINEEYVYERWFLEFLKIKTLPKEGTLLWKALVSFRGALRTHLDDYFVKNLEPYWIQIYIRGIGFVLRDGDRLSKVVVQERIKKGFNVNKKSSQIMDGLSQAKLLESNDRNTMRRMKDEFFDPIIDMHLGRVMRQKFSSDKIKKLLTSGE